MTVYLRPGPNQQALRTLGTSVPFPHGSQIAQENSKPLVFSVAPSIKERCIEVGDYKYKINLFPQKNNCKFS